MWTKPVWLAPLHQSMISSTAVAQRDRHSIRSLVATALASMALVACGGGSATIGGTITNLGQGTTIVLQDNGADDLSVVGTGASSISFTFAKAVTGNDKYNVTVRTQPAGQTCTVSGGTGTVTTTSSSSSSSSAATTTATDVTTVAVACSLTSSIVGTVSGVKAGGAVTLASNGATLVLGNGSYAFAGVLVAGTTYTVTITAQPTGQTCTLSNASGTVLSNAPSTVNVSCT